MKSRLTWIEQYAKLSIEAQCKLIGIPKSSYYYCPVPESQENLLIMQLIDRAFLDKPFLGVLRMTDYLRKQGFQVNQKRIRRLMRLMNLMPIYPKPKLSKANAEHKIYPYLLKNMSIDKPNQVWAIDITYIGMRNGFLYLCAIIDWYSRYIISWQLSNSMNVNFCIEVLLQAFQKGFKPQIFNSDQGSQFTSNDFIELLLEQNIAISMDGKGRATDNVMIERFWRTLKYEYLFLHQFEDGHQLWKGLDSFIQYYNENRGHQSHQYRTPKEMFALSSD